MTQDRGPTAGDRCPWFCAIKCCFGVLGRCLAHCADSVRGIGWIDNRAGRCGPAIGRPRVGRRKWGHRGVDPRQRWAVGKVKPGRVLTRVAEKLRPFGKLNGLAKRVNRAGGDGRRRDIFVHDLVHERRVGTIFQQTPDKIGQQIAVCANWCIDTATGVVVGFDQIVQRFPHAVKPLEFVLGRPDIAVTGQMQDRRSRMGVVCGKLWIDTVGLSQQAAGVRDIADVGCGLLRKDREPINPLDLSALDLGIPIGAFHKANHDFPVVFDGQIIKVIDHQSGALAVGLHDHAEPIPASQRRIGQCCLDHVERQGKAVGLFCVDVQADICGLCLACKVQHQRDQLIHHAVALRFFVAGMKRRQFHRNAGIFRNRCVAVFCNGVDGVAIGHEIVLGVFGCAGRFAKHVVGIGIALGLKGFGAFHGLGNGFAQHKLAAHFTHRARHSRADHRFA